MAKRLGRTLDESHPALAAEALFDPKTVTAGMHAKMPWRCFLGHEWIASVKGRALGGNGCPVCSGKAVLPGFNDLGSTQPHLTSEALFDVTTVTANSFQKLPWRCRLGHEWVATAASRTSGSGCPVCASKVVLAGFNDLATTRPDLASDAVFDATQVTAGSARRLLWKCPRGHEWITTPASRSAGSGCPVCAGKVVLPGFNDLATADSSLASEALFDATTVTPKSGRKLPWRCSLGHEWSASPASRSAGSGCPTCGGRVVRPGFNDLATTHPDLASQMAGDPTTVTRGSGETFRWTCQTGHEWIASVSSRTAGRGCPVCAGRVVVEGANDLASSRPDLAREALFDATRTTTSSQFRGRWRCRHGHEWVATVASRSAGSGCPYCAGKAVQAGFNDLATSHPALAEEALFDSTTVTAGSNKRVAWRCLHGHEWIASPNSRTSTASGCPVCAGRVALPGFNDLATLHPELSAEALFDPTTVTISSGRKLPWKCSRGHVWTAMVASRSAGRGCPVCSGRVVLVGFNDLATTHPDLAAEAMFDTAAVSAGSNRKLPWRCSEGHEWLAVVSNRSAGSGCPTCSATGYDPAKPGWLYLLDHPEWGLRQIGITNQPVDRLNFHSRLGWEVLDLRGPMAGDLAASWERAMLHYMRGRGYQLGRRRGVAPFPGHTESWPTGEFAPSKLLDLMSEVEDGEAGYG